MPRSSILRKAMLAGLVCAVLTGPASAQSFGFATFHALVQSSGVVARGSGVKAATRPSVGRYLVQFTRRVSVAACVYTATPLGPSGGQASVTGVAGRPDTIAVFTFARTGVPANLNFSLLVSCNS